MGQLALEWKADINLHLRCENCNRESVQVLHIPEDEPAPVDMDELSIDAALQNIRYHCRACDCVIGRVFMVSDGRSHARV